jgi:ornithine decarboxylase
MTGDLPTPYLMVDLAVVRHAYEALRTALPAATVLYAVKANSDDEVIRTLADAGSSFDVASVAEIDQCLRLGVPPSRLAFGNTIKKARDVAYAARVGIQTFTVDCAAELEKIVRYAPGSIVYVRLCTDGCGADWPLSRKFGCPPYEALNLLAAASGAGLRVGVSFHVGSQQRNPYAWEAPLACVALLQDRLHRQGIRLCGVNLGGGLPSQYAEPVPSIGEYGSAIKATIAEYLGPHPAQISIEPGRYLVGDAGVIESEIVLISQRTADPEDRWVYLDIGMFNGLAETIGEAIRYRIIVPGRSGPLRPVAIAGPTCDSVDVLYEKQRYPLPADIQIGDRVQLLSTGAYTASYSAVNFNGFQPLRTYIVDGDLVGDRAPIIPLQRAAS